MPRHTHADWAMKKQIVRFVLGLVILAVTGLALLIVYNHQMDEGVRAWKEGNDAVAIEKFSPFASLGDQKAQFFLGSIYAYGIGVAKDEAKAIYWFRRAAMFAAGEKDPAAAAEYGVAMNYAKGTGVKADPAESEKWLRLAADGGSKEAASMLEKLHSH